ncbi:hypothetical protein HGD87_06185 [Rhodobacteraceae bacterium R_SAG9]|nr:hypothetical protein [Rhodobacteraceae bacterium R_SAG9]
MSVFLRSVGAALLATAVGSPAWAQAATPKQLSLELNSVQDVQGACRFTFVAYNPTGIAIEKAVFETVIFDTDGTVVRLSLFDFRDLPTDRPRVRQFDVPATTCDEIGQTLINGTNTCTVNGAQSDICSDGLTLSSRITIKLLG